jgi:hypothetical protein
MSTKGLGSYCVVSQLWVHDEYALPCKPLMPPSAVSMILDSAPLGTIRSPGIGLNLCYHAMIFSLSSANVSTHSPTSGLDPFSLGCSVIGTRLPYNDCNTRCQRMGAAWHMRLHFSALLPILRCGLDLLRRCGLGIDRVPVTDMSLGQLSPPLAATREKNVTEEQPSAALVRGSYRNMPLGSIRLTFVRHKASASTRVCGVF